jgi:hypothetical protein
MRTTRKATNSGRRRLLGGIGAGGLAAAGLIFGKPTAAFAVAAGCCNLCKSPTISVGSCDAVKGHYTWECDETVSVYCLCCETKSPGCPSGVVSAAACMLD